MVAALVVLVVNDHMLKARYPGVVTGKASDLAGVFLAAVVAGAAMHGPRTQRAALAAVGGAFALVKTWAPANHLYDLVMPGSPTRIDGTDLVALATLPCAWWVLRLPPDGVSRRGTETLAGRLVFALSLVAMTATSAALGPPRVDAVGTSSDGTTLYARVITDDYGDDIIEVVSSENGRSWSAVSSPPADVLWGTAQACSAELCFRVVDGERVERRDGPGSWQPEFEFSTSEHKLIGEEHGDFDLKLFRSITLATAAPGPVVAVAMDRDGLLVRSDDGTWSRHAALTVTPTDLDRPAWLLDVEGRVLGAVAIALFLLPLVGFLRGAGVWQVLLIVAAMLGLLLLISVIRLIGDGSDFVARVAWEAGIAGIGLALGGVLAFVPLPFLGRSRRLPPPSLANRPPDGVGL